MTPEERRLARENMRKFHELPPEQRQELHEAFRQFQAMPPDRRDALVRKWRSLTIEQRQAWIEGMHHGHGHRPPPPPRPPLRPGDEPGRPF
jgi:hypothetical protein